MMSDLKRYLCAAGFVLLLPSPSALASMGSGAIWNGFVFQKNPDSTGGFGYWAEEQVRLNDGWNSDPVSAASQPDSLKTRGNRWVFRPALSWRFARVPELMFYFGGTYQPNLSPTRDEFRLWEQVAYPLNFSTGGLTQRVRLEQRHIDRTEGLAHRLRYQIRWASSVSKVDPWGWTLWDEIFWNLNTVSGGPKGGLDQNRVFLGPIYQVDVRTRLELGYLSQFIARGAARDSQLNNILGLFVFFDFTVS